MIGVKPYIAFKGGSCEEAVNFYKDCLGGEILYLGRYGDSPMGNEDNKNWVMHTTLKIGDTHIMACDVGEEHAVTASNISLAVGADDADKMEEMFNRMAEGGTVTMPLQKTFWAESFGMLTDKFGVNWMFNCETGESAYE